ncbi:MAG: hypothetical protein EP297_07870 [Gammaproteobacteria bacterium]|nr:MAG: hypothetical protein EP297_07870 [Gammaproteobacteria bacterium]
MDIIVSSISPAYVFISYALWIALICVAMVLAPWHKIRDSQALNVYVGAIVVLFLIWGLKAEIRFGFNYHLVGATLLCLLFEWQFALMALAAIIAAHTINTGMAWSAYALNWLTLGLTPVLFTRIALYYCQRYLPHNFFIYIFLNAFFAAGIAVYLSGSLSGVLLYLLGPWSAEHLFDQHMMTMLLLVFPEAALTGMMMTLFVVYKPHWVATFHDSWYLKNR